MCEILENQENTDDNIAAVRLKGNIIDDFNNVIFDDFQNIYRSTMKNSVMYWRFQKTF